MNLPTIAIRDRKSAVEDVRLEPYKWNVISIRDSKQGNAPIDDVIGLCRDVLILRFDDVQEKEPGDYVFPTIEDVRTALDWARGRTSILVHCHAGVSRSSAIAYLIACDMVGPEKAISILNPHIHFPNSLLVSFGAEILKDSMVSSVCETWKNQIFSPKEDKVC